MVVLTHDDSNTHIKFCHSKSQSGKVSWENEMYSSLLSMEKSRNRQLESLMEKAMTPHSRTLVWKIPWTKEPGGLQSMESLRVGHS